MNLELEGHVALVTCASEGVGRACAERLLLEGARVIAISRTATLANFDGVPGRERLTVLQADLADGPEFEKRIDGLLSNLPVVPDILVFVPLRELNLPVLEVDSRMVEGAVDRNFGRFLFLVQRLLPSMREKRFGRVVTLLGASTLAPLADHVPANMSRVAIANLVAGMSREFAADGISANNILMGPFETPGLIALWDRRATARSIPLNEFIRQSADRVPAKRLGKPSECAHLCALLVSPVLGFLTGQSVLLDGGVNLNL